MCNKACIRPIVAYARVIFTPHYLHLIDAMDHVQ